MCEGRGQGCGLMPSLLCSKPSPFLEHRGCKPPNLPAPGLGPLGPLAPQEVGHGLSCSFAEPGRSHGRRRVHTLCAGELPVPQELCACVSWGTALTHRVVV